jgi:hypothetical protein
MTGPSADGRDLLGGVGRRANPIPRQAWRWAECPVERLPFPGTNPVLRDGARSSEYA